MPFQRRGTPNDVANMISISLQTNRGTLLGSDFKIDGGWLVVDAG